MKTKGSSKIEQIAQEQGYPTPEATAVETPQVAAPSEKATLPILSKVEEVHPKEVKKITLLEGQGRVVEATARATISTGQYENLILEAKYQLGSEDTTERLFNFYEMFYKEVRAFKSKQVEATAVISAPQATIRTATQGKFVPATQMPTMSEPQGESAIRYPDWRGMAERPDGLPYPVETGEPMSEKQGKLAYVLWCKQGKPEEIRPPRNMTKVEAMKYIDTFDTRRG